MKWLPTLVGSVLLSLAATASATSTGARLLQPSDMQRAPQTAVIMTQCNLLIAGYFTLQDGSLVKLDQRSQQTFPDVNEVLLWGDSAAHGAERVDAECAQPAAAESTSLKVAGAAKPQKEPHPAATGQGEMIAVVELKVCNEVLGVMALKERGFSVVRLEDNDPPEYWKAILDQFTSIRKANGPAYIVPLKEDCEAL